MSDQLVPLVTYSPKCTLFRYAVDVEAIEALRDGSSRYSPDFLVGGVTWRLHMQVQLDEHGEAFVGVHLQCLSNASPYTHFRIVFCNLNPAVAKAKSFQCHYIRSGSAWGLNRFVPVGLLLNPTNGFISSMPEDVQSSFSRGRVVMQLVLRVLDPQPDGGVVLGVLPQSSRDFSFQQPQSGAIPSALSPIALSSQQITMPVHQALDFRPGLQLSQERARSTATGYMSQSHAALVFPFGQLEQLCDMAFDVNGVTVRAHRCIIATRMGILIPPELMPLEKDCVIAISDDIDVFNAFLRYLYREELPTQGAFTALSLIDLYLLGARCEFFDLCGACLALAKPLLTGGNILDVIMSKYSIGDEVLNALYLQLLVDNHEALIQDERFENIPGHLFRRMSLVMRGKERIPSIRIPPTQNTLSHQLMNLATTGEYADYHIRVADGAYLPCHRFVLAARSGTYMRSFITTRGQETVPDSTSENFSPCAWQAFLLALYKNSFGESEEGTAGANLPPSAEDIVMVCKMHAVLSLDGGLRQSAVQSVRQENALRVLMYAAKYDVPELRSAAMECISSNFKGFVAQDPKVWDTVEELPQQALVKVLKSLAS